MDTSAKILLLGKTGVGKSAFINYYLGKKVARSAAGKPVTQEYFIPYKIEEGKYPIIIYDTKGLEAMDANNQLDQIMSGIKQRNNSEDIFNWFHTIFYCVSMANARFEDFEAEFIRRLQRELTQHIHIILTHCDVVGEDSIRNMRKLIADKLGNQRNIEIFEVVCVHKKKRNGTIVQPRGRDVLVERVFDLLLEDIANKLSYEYAKELHSSLKKVAEDLLQTTMKIIDQTVRIKTLYDFCKDSDKVDQILNEKLKQIEQELEKAQKETDEKFVKILKPVERLYSSYRGVITSDFVRDAELTFDDSVEWCTNDWYEEAEKILSIKNFFPKTVQKGFMDEDGNARDTNDFNLTEALKMLTAIVSDLFSFKQQLKEMAQVVYNRFIQLLPSEKDLQQKAYQRIIEFVKIKS